MEFDERCVAFSMYSSLLPGHKLEWPIFTTALPVPGHERVNTNKISPTPHHMTYGINNKVLTDIYVRMKAGLLCHLNTGLGTIVQGLHPNWYTFT